MTFEEWAKTKIESEDLSPTYEWDWEYKYANDAWNAALGEAERIIKETQGVEKTPEMTMVLQLEELKLLET